MVTCFIENFALNQLQLSLLALSPLKPEAVDKRMSRNTHLNLATGYD